MDPRAGRDARHVDVREPADEALRRLESEALVVLATSALNSGAEAARERVVGAGRGQRAARLSQRSATGAQRVETALCKRKRVWNGDGVVARGGTKQRAERRERESGALLLKRHERKCGSARNGEKPVYVCVVPHADPKLCPIVHIAAALGNREIDPAYELFAEGFTYKPGQDYVTFSTLIQRRYIAVLQSAAVAIGVPALFAEKKLHAFQVQCTNVLGSTGASEAEREAHIGWQSTVQSRRYASLKHTAMNARTGTTSRSRPCRRRRLPLSLSSLSLWALTGTPSR